MRYHLAFVGVDDGVEVGLVIAAVLTVIILACLWIVAGWVAKLCTKIPVIGHYLAGAFDWASKWARGAMLATLHGTLWALGKLAKAVRILIENQLTLYKDAADALISAVEHTRYVAIGRAIESLRTWTAANFRLQWSDVLAYGRQIQRAEDRKITQLRRYTLKLLGDVNRTLQAELIALRQAIDARITQAVNGLTAQLQALARKETADIAKVEADIKAAEQAAITQALARALADIDAEAAGAAAKVWAGIDADVQQLRQQLAGDFPDVQAALQLLPALAPVTLPTVVEAGLAGLPPLLRLAVDCTVPTCRDLGPLRDLLHTLAGDAFTAALLAWLIYCITEPSPAAADTAAVLDPVAGAVMDPLLALLRAA